MPRKDAYRTAGVASRGLELRSRAGHGTAGKAGTGAVGQRRDRHGRSRATRLGEARRGTAGTARHGMERCAVNWWAGFKCSPEVVWRGRIRTPWHAAARRGEVSRCKVWQDWLASSRQGFACNGATRQDSLVTAWTGRDWMVQAGSDCPGPAREGVVRYRSARQGRRGLGQESRRCAWNGKAGTASPGHASIGSARHGRKRMARFATARHGRNVSTRHGTRRMRGRPGNVPAPSAGRVAVGHRG